MESEETSDSAIADQPQEASISGLSLDNTKGARVLFIYTCPTGSPIKFRMVYSSGVRGIQQDATDKSGIEIIAKVSEE